MWPIGLVDCAVTKISPGSYQPSASDRAVAVAAARKVLRLKTVPRRESVDFERQVIENFTGGT